METMNLRKGSFNSFFVECKYIHAIAVFPLIIIMGLVSITAKAQEWTDLTSRFIKNAGFDEDLTWNADGSKKGEIVGTQELSNRSIAVWAADSTVYATVNPVTPKSRQDGRTFDATNGFIGRVQGWTIETNQEFREWVYFGTLPYALGDEAIPVADDGSTYITVPAKPEGNNTDDNIGFVYMRAGWGAKAIYKQTMNLPSANYRLEFKTINLNANGRNGTNLSKVIDSNGNIFEDETGITSTQWTQHSISFHAKGATTIQVGFEALGGSGSNPFLAIDDVKLYLDPKIEIKENVFTYSGKRPTLSFANYEYFEIVDYDSLALQTDAGSYTSDILFHIKDTGSEEIYEIEKPFSYTINKASLHVKAKNVSREYGDENPILSFEYTGFVNNEDQNVLSSIPTATTTAMQMSNVGEYPITISSGTAKNYSFVYEPGVLTITKADLSAKVKDAKKVYGESNPTFILEYNGLKNGETVPTWTTKPTFTTDATRSSNVGQYEVKAANAIPMNYNLGEITAGILSVTPAPLTIKANDATRQYYRDDPIFSYTCNGFVNGENENVLSSKPRLTTTANMTSNVGTYPIKASRASNPNYSISYVDGTLTITPRTLYASVGNYERVYNEDNPEFEVKYDGFVGNEDENVLITKATVSTKATRTSDVGSYPINVSGGSADNYKFSYTSGTLTINKAEQTIAWEQDFSNLKVGDQMELQAVASSGLPITYIIESNSLAEIYSAGNNKNYLDCKAYGQFIIRAMQEGNKNYYSTQRISKKVTIVDTEENMPALTIKLADNGSISTKVNKGSSHTFMIQVENGWKIHSVAFNDDDVTSQLDSQDIYTTPAINENSTLVVVYEKEEENAVSSARESSVKIQGTSFGIRVIDANMGDTIQIYSADGILEKSSKVEKEITNISLSKDKVYIVKVGKKTVKLSL